MGTVLNNRGLNDECRSRIAVSVAGARNFELLAGFMKSAADFADEAGRKLLKVFKAVVITGDETGECRKEDMIDLARHEAFLELVKRPETVDEEMYRSVFYEKLKRVLTNLVMLEDIPLYQVLTEQEQKVIDGVFDKLLKLADAEE